MNARVLDIQLKLRRRNHNWNAEKTGTQHVYLCRRVFTSVSGFAAIIIQEPTALISWRRRVRVTRNVATVFDRRNQADTKLSERLAVNRRDSTDANDVAMADSRLDDLKGQSLVRTVMLGD